MRCARRLLPVACALPAVEQVHAVQSVHVPASMAAESVHAFAMAMYVGAALVALFVFTLLLRALTGPPRETGSGAFLLGGGIIFPAAVLSVLLILALLLDNRLSRPLGPAAARIEVIGQQWWWEVRYRPPPQPAGELALLLQRLTAPGGDPERARPITGANEIRIPVGHAVEIEVRSRDVIHSLWVPALGGKVDLVPGRTHRLTWRAERAGTYRGQCAEYCGAAHGRMALVVVAEPEDVYRDWLEREAQAARAQAGLQQRRPRGAEPSHAGAGALAAHLESVD